MENRAFPGWVIPVCMTPPSLGDNRADADRLAAALKSALTTDAVEIDLPLLRCLSGLLRQYDYKVRCVCLKAQGRWRLTGLAPVDSALALAGVAIDLGTTRVVLRLIDLETGEELAETAMDNPQIAIGPDVLERIHFADRKAGLDTLHRLVIDGLNRQIRHLCETAGIKPSDVHLLALAGNTSMTHLFLGLPPGGIIREPYIPAANTFAPIRAAELGLAAGEHARVFVFPNVGSYFGGDLISGILYSGLHRREEIAMLVDVGTNAEVLLGNRDWLVACAGAAGPALEGGVSDIGMTAKPGVIDRVDIDSNGELAFHAIGEQKPVGICGSGMIDLAAQLFVSGRIDIRGRLVPEKCGHRLKEEEGMRGIIIVPGAQSATGRDLSISQADIDSLVRSKAAMYTILETITAYVGVGFTDLSVFYVAGTFGSFIRPRSAITIGMIPDLPERCFQVLGNSSLGGASLLLKQRGAMDEIEAIRDRITYLELNVNQEFMNRFSAAKFIPHTDPSLFPSVHF